MIVRVVLFLAVVAFASLPARSPAAIVTVEFSGTVLPEYFAVPESLAGQVQPGSLVTGSYSFDDSELDLDPLVTQGFYEVESPNFLSITLGSFHVTTESAPYIVQIRVWNDFENYDGYVLDSYRVSGIASYSDSLVDIGLGLTDLTGSALNSDALPVAPPLDAFAFYRQGFVQDSVFGDTGINIGFSLTEWHVVSEPSLFALVFSAAAAFGIRRRA